MEEPMPNAPAALAKSPAPLPPPQPPARRHRWRAGEKRFANAAESRRNLKQPWWLSQVKSIRYTTVGRNQLGTTAKLQHPRRDREWAGLTVPCTVLSRVRCPSISNWYAYMPAGKATRTCHFPFCHSIGSRSESGVNSPHRYTSWPYSPGN